MKDAVQESSESARRLSFSAAVSVMSASISVLNASIPCAPDRYVPSAMGCPGVAETLAGGVLGAVVVGGT
jgi:hypothetical protein